MGDWRSTAVRVDDAAASDWRSTAVPVVDDRAQRLVVDREMERLRLREPISEARALGHGYLDMVPGGQQVGSGLASGVLGLLKKAGESGVGPRYLANIGDTSYGGTLGRARAGLARSEKEQPAFTLGGKLVGGGVSAAALAPFEAPTGVMAMTPGLRAAGRYLATGGNAGLWGTLHGFGRGDTMGERLGNAATEGPMTAALGVGGEALMSAGVPAFRSVADYMKGGLRNFANQRAVKATFPMLADYRGLAAQGRLEPMGEALRESGVVSGVPFRSGGAGPEETLARARTLRTSEGEKIGQFLDEVSGMQSVNETKHTIESAIHGEVPVESQRYVGWEPVEEIQRTQSGNIDPFHLPAPKHAGQSLGPDQLVEPGVFEQTVIRPRPIHETVTEMQPATVGYQPKEVVERNIVDKFDHRPLVQALRSQLGPKYKGMGQSGMGTQLETMIREAEEIGSVPFSRINAEKAKLQDSINYNNVAEKNLNALKKDVARVTNAEMERQAEAMLQANGASPETFAQWLKHKEMYGHASSAVDTLSDHLSRAEANRFVSPSDYATALTSGLGAFQVTHDPVLTAATSAAIGGLNHLGRTRGNAAASSFAGALSEGAPTLAGWLARLGQRSPGTITALRSSARSALNVPALQFAGGTPQENEATLSELYANAMRGGR